MTNKAIKFIAIAILTGISLLAVNAQDITETSTVTETTVVSSKEKKVEPKAKRQSSDEDSWTGFYVGGFGGYTNGRSSANLSTISAGYIANPIVLSGIAKDGTQRINSKGFNGGGTFGYNYQKGKFFVGGEVDFGAHRINQTVTTTTPIRPDVPNETKTISHSVKSNWLFTARPKIGVAFNKAVVYATGGVAVTNIKYNGTYSDTTLGAGTESGSFSKTKAGTSLGGGVEFKVASKWSVKGEYLLTQFGRISTTSTNLIGFGGQKYPAQVFTHSTDLKSHSIRFGVNYRF